MHIVAAERFIDNEEKESQVLPLIDALQSQKIPFVRLNIDPLSAGWNTPLQKHHFRSGCGPVEALVEAKKLLSEGCEAVLIEGLEPLRSAFVGRKELRQKLMNIYGDEVTIPQAYTQLAREFLKREKVSESDFEDFAGELFENFRKTAARRGLSTKLPAERFEKVTPLFRAVDCANPSVDFLGRVLLTSKKLRDRLKLRGKSVRVSGVAVEESPGDGPSHLGEIAAYSSLSRVFHRASSEASVDFVREFKNKSALLEVYSCFPIVPLAFLLKCGFAASIAETSELLRTHEVSVTGGMNLAKAPWNCPVLNAMVVMFEQMTTQGFSWGGLHGNGGLGYKQGFAILALD